MNRLKHMKISIIIYCSIISIPIHIDKTVWPSAVSKTISKWICKYTYLYNVYNISTWRVHSLVRRTVPQRRLTLGRAPACVPRGSRHCPQTENMESYQNTKVRETNLKSIKAHHIIKWQLWTFKEHHAGKQASRKPQAASRKPQANISKYVQPSFEA